MTFCYYSIVGISLSRFHSPHFFYHCYNRDYYTVFCELESQLQDEFDFVAEAVAMDRIYQTISRDQNGLPCEPSVVLPRPVAGLVSKRVLVMDYLSGVPLSR
jgi:aarF domain-containing kinase